MPEYRLVRFRGKFALAIIDDAGRRISRLTLNTTDRREAERKLAEQRAKHSKPERITVAYLWQQYRDDKAAKRIAGNMEFSGKAILPFFGHMTPDEISTGACRDYTAKRAKIGRKPGTIWTELNHLQIVISWAAKHRMIPHGVAIERPSKPDARDRRITRAEARRLLDAAEKPHVGLAIALMLGTGARTGAILDLTWDRVDLERGLIQYANPDLTGRRKGRATVPMTPDVRARLLAAREGAISDYVVEWAGKRVGSVKKGFARAVERAGLTDVSPHVLRHTAASWMAESGTPMAEIAAVLGHSDSRTTERIYAKFTPGHLSKAIAALDMSGVPLGSPEPESGNET